MEKTMKMSWRANEFYREYLELKTEIAELAQKADLADSLFFGGATFFGSEQPTDKKKHLDEKLERMKVVLWELNAGGVTAEKLLYLSWGIEVE